MVFKCGLRLELPHSLSQIKSVILKRNSELCVLKACLFPWAKSSQVGGDGGLLLSERHEQDAGWGSSPCLLFSSTCVSLHVASGSEMS